MKKTILILLLAGMILGAAGWSAPAEARHGRVFIAPLPLPILVPPPPPRVELFLPVPIRGQVWIPGHWVWNGNSYVWVTGYWERAPYAGAIWVPGYWAHGPRGWHWRGGHWRGR